MNLKSIIYGVLATLMLAVTLQAQGEIKAGRAVKITISGVPTEDAARIAGDYPVADNGTINMPHIGLVAAAGRKADALAQTIQSLYKSKQIFTNPTVQVFVNTTDSLVEQVVHVGGQVGHTGPVKFTQGMTLYQAVQAAGGPTAFGTMRRVKVYRDGKMRQYDLTQGQFMTVPVNPNDTIEVPQKGIFDTK